MKLEKPLYVVCPLYRAKKRFKVADRDYTGKIMNFVILKCEIIGENKDNKSTIVKIIDNKEQHQFLHHKKKDKNIIMVKNTSVNSNKDVLDSVKTCLFQTFAYTDLYDCKFGM